MASILGPDGVSSNTVAGTTVDFDRITPRLYITYNSATNDIKKSHGVSSIVSEQHDDKLGQKVNFIETMSNSDSYTTLATGGYVDDTSTIAVSVTKRTSNSCFVHQTFMSNNPTRPTRISLAIFN